MIDYFTAFDNKVFAQLHRESVLYEKSLSHRMIYVVSAAVQFPAITESMACRIFIKGHVTPGPNIPQIVFYEVSSNRRIHNILLPFLEHSDIGTTIVEEVYT